MNQHETPKSPSYTLGSANSPKIHYNLQSESRTPHEGISPEDLAPEQNFTS